MSTQGPGQLLFTFVRHWSRRGLDSDSTAEQGRLVLVTEAVHTLAQRGVSATVNAVAQEIGFDQSGASRLVKNATKAGYVHMITPDSDGRQRHAAVTPRGRVLLQRAHEWQEQIFDRLTPEWSDHQRHTFQLAMIDLMDNSFAMNP